MFGGNLGIIGNAIQNENGGQGLSAIGAGINDFMQDKPAQSEITTAIDNYVKAPKPKTDWGGLAMGTLKNMKPIGQSTQSSMPAAIPSKPITWTPTTITPLYLQANYQQQPSFISNKKNLYNYLMR